MEMKKNIVCNLSKQPRNGKKETNRGKICAKFHISSFFEKQQIICNVKILICWVLMSLSHLFIKDWIGWKTNLEFQLEFQEF